MPEHKLYLNDDRTLDTVIWCEGCSFEERSNYQIADWFEGDYDAFVDWLLEEARINHVIYTATTVTTN